VYIIRCTLIGHPSQYKRVTLSVDFSALFPLSYNRQHQRCDDFLEVGRENYQNCSVLCCVWHLCIIIHTRVNSS